MVSLFRGRGVGFLQQLMLLLLLLYLAGFLYFILSSTSTPTPRQQAPMDFSLVDDIIKGRWHRKGEADSVERSSALKCSPPQQDVVFIKCMKCATETLGTVFRRYALVHNLSSVLPVGRRIYLGWPFPLGEADFRPSSRGFNMLMEHAVYNGTLMRRVMRPGAVFVTMIRHPLELLVSSLHYFNAFRLAGVPLTRGMEAVHAYLSNLSHYEKVYQSREAAPKRWCIPDGFSITRNLLSHCLGMPVGFPAGSKDISGDAERVRRYVRALDSEFLLVMLVEYFDESLVLLRRLLCWSVKDIVYHRVNQGQYAHNLSWAPLTPEDRQAHRSWSRADYLLYSHFNASFWRRVGRQGPGFAAELGFFRQVQRRVTAFCRKVAPYGDSQIRFGSSPWSPAFSFSREDCALMDTHLLTKLKEQYEREEPQFANYSKDDVVKSLNLKALC